MDGLVFRADGLDVLYLGAQRPVSDVRISAFELGIYAQLRVSALYAAGVNGQRVSVHGDQLKKHCEQLVSQCQCAK